MMADTEQKDRKEFHRRRFLKMLTISVAIHLFLLISIVASIQIFPREKMVHSDYSVNLTVLPQQLQKNIPDFRPPPPKEALPKKPDKPIEKPKEAVPVPMKNLNPTPQPKPESKAEEIEITAESPPEEQTDSEESFSMGKSTTGINRSGAMTLDTANFPFTYYLVIVRDKIARNWFPPFSLVPVGDSKTIIVFFRISSNGTVFDAKIEGPSGLELLDQSALRAVLVSNPFPPLPFGFTEKDLGIHFRFICYR